MALVAIVVAVSVSAMFLAFAFGFIAVGTRDLARSQGMAFGMTAGNIALLRLAWVIVAASLTTPVFALFAWRRRWWNVFGRLCFTVLALGAVTTVHFLLWWQYIPGRW